MPNPSPGPSPSSPSPNTQRPTPSSPPQPGTPSVPTPSRTRKGKPATTSAENSALSTGAIIGIAAGSIVVLILAIVGIMYCLKRRREEDEKVDTPEYQAPTSFYSRKQASDSQPAYIAASNASTSQLRTSPSAASSFGTVLAAPSNPPSVVRQTSAASSAGPSDDFSRAQQQFYAKQTSPAGSYARDTMRFSDARGSEYMESTVAPGAQDWWNAMERKSEAKHTRNNMEGKPSLHQFSDADDVSSRGSYEL